MHIFKRDNGLHSVEIVFFFFYIHSDNKGENKCKVWGTSHRLNFYYPCKNVVFILQGQQWVQTHNIKNIFSEFGFLALHSAPRELRGSLGSQGRSVGRTESLAVSPQGLQREGKEIQIVLRKMFVKIMNIFFLSIKMLLALIIIKVMKHRSVQCKQSEKWASVAAECQCCCCSSCTVSNH